jgi:predicted Rossmann fold flavoprotein
MAVLPSVRCALRSEFGSSANTADTTASAARMAPVMRLSYDAVVLGAGAAGLMCAIEAGKRGRRVALIDHADRIGKKILISGGGRCNFTNLHCCPEAFLSSNPHFVKTALARYTPEDFLALVRRYRIAYHEKTVGQLFCDHRASDITHMLEQEATAAGVALFLSSPVKEVSRGASGFRVEAGEQTFHAPVVVVATGGLSIPKMGATGAGYEMARKFGVRITETRPALVPLLFGNEDRARYTDLAGVSTEAVAAFKSQSFRESLLFTHRGVSGPAILQISSYWRPGQPLEIDLAPEVEVTAPLLQPGARRDLTAARQRLRQVLPNRLADRWLEVHAPARWSNPALAEFERHLHCWQVIPAGTEGYEKAEVTAGGVDTRDLSSKTMECRHVPGLYFIGEVVDVTGHLGGYNFQWAWASGYCAGQAL